MSKQHTKKQSSNAAKISTPSYSDSKIAFFFAAVYGIILLFIAFKYHTVGDYDVETDFFWSYVPEAKELLKGKFLIDDFRGPGYPIMLALMGAVVKNYFSAGIILSVLSASCVLFFSFSMLRKFFPANFAFLGTLLVAVNPTFVRYSYTAGTDMLFNVFSTAAVFFLLKEEERKWKWILSAAVFASFAYLTRYNGIFVLVGIPIAILLFNIYKLPWRNRILTTAVFFAVFVLVMSPWGIYCYHEKGSFFYNKNYINIAYEMYAKGKIGWDQYWHVDAAKYSSLAQVIFSDTGLFFSTIVNNAYTHAVSDMKLLLGWQTGIFVLIGIALFIKKRPGNIEASYYTIGATFFGVLLLVFYGERFTFFLLPMYVALALRVFSWEKVTEFKFSKQLHVGVLALAVILVWTFVESKNYNSEKINSGPTEIPIIAEAFKKQFGDRENGKFIIARKPHIAYYTDLEMSGFPYVNTIEELQAEAVRIKASYLFFGIAEANMRPQFQILLNPQSAPAWLRPVAYTLSPPSVLYKIEIQK